MYTQKLYKNGNSIAVTIPKEFLKNLKLSKGSKVVVDVNSQGLIIKKAAKKTKKPSALTPEFKIWLDEVTSKHSKLIKKLAKK